MPDGTCSYCGARRPLRDLQSHQTKKGKLICRDVTECVRLKLEKDLGLR